MEKPQAAQSKDFDFFAPTGRRLKSDDFFSCHTIGATSCRSSVGSSKSPLFSEHWQQAAHPVGHEAVRPQDGLGLMGGLTAWCQGVVDQLERSVPSGAKQQDLLSTSIRSLPSFGACIPRVKLAQVAIAASSYSPLTAQGKSPRLRTTVALAKATARRRGCKLGSTCAQEGDEADRKGVESVALIASSKRLREVSWTISNHAVMGLTTLFGAGQQSEELRATTCGLLASVLAPLSTGGSSLAVSGAAGGPVMAFCPIDFGCLGNGFSLSKCAPMRELTLQELETGVLVATFVQGSLGLFRICLGDVFSGCYSLLLATLGYNSRRPGPASNWLKTYVLITFINGTMSGIDLCQNMLLQNYPVLLPALPLAVNMAHLVQLLVPWVSFLGAYCGWQHIKMQRKLTIQAYQDQIAMMMEQPPWPPPPLPFPLPGMPGIQMVEDDGETMQLPGWQRFPPGMPGMGGNFGRLAAVQEMPEEEAEAPATVGGSSSRESKQQED